LIGGGIEITATREHVNHLGVGHEYDGPSCSMTRAMIRKVAASSGVGEMIVAEILKESCFGMSSKRKKTQMELTGF
jgi:hypothetical protein